MAILGNIGEGFGKMMRVREKQAELSVHAYLASLDDATLTQIGVRRDSLKAGGNVNYFL